MLILQWQCLTCARTTSPVQVPFGYHPPIPRTDIYCIVCQAVSSHAAGVTETECAPIRTMGELLAAARAEEKVENGILEILAA